MKRHLALTGAAAPLLVLTFAIAAQALPSDDPSTAETTIDEPARDGTPGAPAGELPLAPSDIPTDPTLLPPVDDLPSPSAVPTLDPSTAIPEAPLPEPVQPSDGVLDRTSDPSLGSADIEITLAATDLVPGAVLVSGFVPGVEAEGRCSLTLTREGEVHVIEADATPDATTTVCGGLTMSTADLSHGTWSATLSYLSPNRSGVSDARTITIR